MRENESFVVLSGEFWRGSFAEARLRISIKKLSRPDVQVKLGIQSIQLTFVSHLLSNSQILDLVDAAGCSRIRQGFEIH